ncbi:MAG: hypothetical protein ABI724_16060 [Betaproteobacteria bacterium]
MFGISKRVAFVAAVPAIALSGCYIVPIAPDGSPMYPYPYAQTPHPGYAPPPVVVGAPSASVLQARLYPANELASQTGMIAGTVTNMMTGKGRFQMDYKGELLTGEATRVSGDDRRGVASAYGPRGTYMSCEYKMTSPYQGAGMCTMSTGAQYQVHLGG